jgi:signal transduction histidine kinase
LSRLGKKLWRSVPLRAALVCGTVVGLVAFVAGITWRANERNTETIVTYTAQQLQLDVVSGQLSSDPDAAVPVLPLDGPLVADGEGYSSNTRAFLAVLVDGDLLVSTGDVVNELFDTQFDSTFVSSDIGEIEEAIAGGISDAQTSEGDSTIDFDSVELSDLDLGDIEIVDIEGPEISDAVRRKVLAATGMSPEVFLLAGGGWVENDDGTVQVLQPGESPDDLPSQTGFGLLWRTEVVGDKTIANENWSYAERVLTAEDDTEYRIVSATPAPKTLTNLNDPALGSLPLAVVVGLVAATLAGWLTQRALGQVDDMREEVENITQRSLDRRVPTSGAGDVIDRLALTMNDMLERLSEANESQVLFMANASHELRSPIAGLLAQLDVVAMYPDKVDTATTLPRLRDEVHRLELLVNDLLYLSRTEVGQLQDFEPVAVDPLLAEEVEHQQRLNPELAVTVAGSCEREVAGLERDLTRAVRNLMSNAAKHATSTVSVGAELRGEEIRISVTDDGAGIAPDEAEKIFDRFVRLDEGRSRDTGGAGLGLPITAEIVHRHRGTLELEPDNSNGTVFCITLPVHTATGGRSSAMPTPQASGI